MEYTGERFVPNCDGPEIEAEHVHRYRAVSSCINPNMHVLDAGCGTGYGSFVLAQSANSVKGIDISEESIQWCKEQYETQENLTFIQASLEKLPFVDGEFDCVVNLEVIEHVDKSIQLAFLKEVKRVLKRTGVLIMSTPNKMVYTDKSGYQNPFHVCEFYPDEFKDYLAQEFEHVKIYNQTLDTVSTILDQTKMDGKVQFIKNQDIDSTEKYMIAVCGNTKDSFGQFDLGSIYKYDNPLGVSIASLYPAINDNEYSELFKQSKALVVQADNIFSITFDISECSEVSRFRFDPIENFFSVCNINEVLTDGKVESVLPLNAMEYYRTGFSFMNIDPQFEINGDFSKATYLTLNGYFKVMSHIEIGEFVNAFYSKMMTRLNDSKNIFSSDSLIELIGETKTTVAEQRMAFQRIDTMLSEHQNTLLISNQILQNQAELINKANSTSSEERVLLNSIASTVVEQGQLLQDIHNIILKRGKISNVIDRIYRNFGEWFRKKKGDR